MLRMPKALYDYATLRSGATWDGKRPGLRVSPVDVHWRSCGAFRRWQILSHDGRVCFTMDGFRHRAGHDTGHVGVLVGDGHFIFPIDDSRTDHSLEMQCSEGSSIVWVKPEDPIPWQERIDVMCQKLEDAHRELSMAIDAYDAEQKRIREEKRRSQVQAAVTSLT